MKNTTAQIVSFGIMFISSNTFAGGSQSKVTEGSIENAYTITESATQTGSTALIHRSHPQVKMLSQVAQCSIGIAHVCLQNKESLRYLAEFAKTTDVDSMDCTKAEELMSNVASTNLQEIFKSFGLSNKADQDTIETTMKSASASTIQSTHAIKSLLNSIIILKNFKTLQDRKDFEKITKEIDNL